MVYGRFAFTRCKTFRMGLIRLFLSVHTQDHAPCCVIVPAFFCCRATAAADGAEARVQRLPALRVLTQCTLLPHDLSARQGRTRVALILAKRCSSSSHDVSERAQRRGGASPSLAATIHHLPLPVVNTTGSHLNNRIATPAAARSWAGGGSKIVRSSPWCVIFWLCAEKPPRARGNGVNLDRGLHPSLTHPHAPLPRYALCTTSNFRSAAQSPPLRFSRKARACSLTR